MPIDLQPIQTTLDGTVCEALGVLRADVFRNLEGCEVLARLRAFTLDQGWQGQLEWNLQKDDGTNANLISCYVGGSLDDSLDTEDTAPTVEVCFSEASVLAAPKKPLCAAATIEDPETGRCRVDVPTAISDQGGVFRATWTLTDTDGRRILMNPVLVSVGDSDYGDPHRHGVPSLQEIRVHLRDYDNNNRILNGREFSSAELLVAMLTPIREWNDTPPQIATMSSAGFPYRHYWVRAIIGYLYEMAALSYFRDDLPYTSGAVAINDRNKGPAYRKIADQYLGEWRAFLAAEKNRLNHEQCYGSLGSDYGVYSGRGTF